MKFCTLTLNGNALNVTEPIFEKHIFLAENARKNGFSAFSRDFIISFFKIFAQVCWLAMLKILRVWFLRKLFSGWKCRKSPILQIFITVPYISLFFHTRTLLTTIPTIKNGSIFNKTDFWSRDFLNIVGTADFLPMNKVWNSSIEIAKNFF